LKKLLQKFEAVAETPATEEAPAALIQKLKSNFLKERYAKVDLVST